MLKVVIAQIVKAPVARGQILGVGVLIHNLVVNVEQTSQEVVIVGVVVVDAAARESQHPLQDVSNAVMPVVVLQGTMLMVAQEGTEVTKYKL